MISDSLTHPRVLAGPWILVLLAEEPSHGYDLIQRLHDVGFAWGSPSGPIYRELTKMSAEGLISSTLVSPRSGPSRRVYELTLAGRAELHAVMGALDHLTSLISDLIRRYEDLTIDHPPAAAVEGPPAAQAT